MNIGKILEKLMESTYGDGNPHWKRDFVIAAILISIVLVSIISSIIALI